MKQFLVRFLWTAVAAGVLYGGFVAYVHWWGSGSGELAKTASSVVKTVETKTPQVAESVKNSAGEYAGKVVTEAAQSAGDFLKQKVADALSLAAQTALDSARSLLGSPVAPEAASGTSPAPQGSAFFVPPPPATIIAKVGTPLSFSINSGTHYTIDWGDGKFEDGGIASSSVEFLNHSWTAAGDYTVKITVTAPDTTHAYTFPVRVFE